MRLSADRLTSRPRRILHVKQESYEVVGGSGRDVDARIDRYSYV